MQPVFYQPEGDPFPHLITAEILDEDPHGAVFLVRSDGEELGEVDIDLLCDERGFVSAVGPGEKINNGYLRPACFAIVNCLAEREKDFEGLYSLDDEVILHLH
jgi:hypothetical protein